MSDISGNGSGLVARDVRNNSRITETPGDEVVVVVVLLTKVVVVVVVILDVALTVDALEKPIRRRRVDSKDGGVAALDVATLDVATLDVAALGAAVGFFFLRRTTSIYSFTKKRLN